MTLVLTEPAITSGQLRMWWDAWFDVDGWSWHVQHMSELASEDQLNPATLVAFVRQGRPPSANKGSGGVRGAKFREDLQRLYREAGGTMMSGHLYGRCYYYVRRYNWATDADVGAASKQLWDDLQNVAYDDRIVITRIDHREDLSQLSDFAEIDIGRMPSSAFEQFTEALADDKVAHFYM